MSDESWAPVARDTRQALELLGYPIKSQCLPDEPDPCGGTFSQHAAAHLATIKAICDHQFLHLGSRSACIRDDVYRSVRAELSHKPAGETPPPEGYGPLCNCQGDGWHVHIDPSEDSDGA